MRSVRLLAASVAALLASGVAVASEGVAVAHTAVSHPAAPSAVRAYQTAHGVKITWTNPRSAFDHVVLRYRRGVNAPVRVDQGTALQLADRAHAASLTRLASNARYAVTIWTRDNAGHFSSRATTHFTTAPAAVAHRNGTVSGLVTDTAGHPLAHVALTDDYGTVSARTDSAGRFSISAAPGILYLIIDGTNATGGPSDATGYDGDFFVVHVHSGRVSSVRSRLHPAGALTGRAVDSAGNPVAGVRVGDLPVNEFVHVDNGVLSSYGYAGFAPTVTRADGTFRLRGAAPYSSQLCLSTAPHATDPRGIATHCLDRPVAVSPTVTRAVGDIVVTRTHGGAVRIVLLDAAGHRIAHGYVIGDRPDNRDDDGSGRIDTRTDALGRATATGLPAGRYQICGNPGDVTPATGSGSIPGCVRATVRAGATTDVTLRLARGAAISGTVRGPGGRPLADVSVTIDGKHDAYGYATTDAHGRYVAGAVRAGTYVVCAGRSDTQSSAAATGARAGCYDGRTHVLATTGAIRTGIDITLPAGAAIAGTVTTNGATDVFVDAESLTSFDDADGASPDAKGRFTIAGLTAARYRVCAEASYFSGPRTEACTATSTRLYRTAHVKLALPKTGSVTATATDADGLPLSGVDAALYKSCTGSDDPDEGQGCGPIASFRPSRDVEVVATTMTFIDGRATLDGVPPGKYALCALGYDAINASAAVPVGGYADRCTADFDVTVTAGKTSTAGLTLAAGATVSGRVTDAKGNPIKNVRVRLSHGAVVDQSFTADLLTLFDRGPSAQAITDAKGRYTLRSASAVAQTICFDASFAGTSKSGYQDQCVGGVPGHTNDGSLITLQAGPNPDVNQVLKPGPPRDQYPNARTRTRSTDRAGTGRRHLLVRSDGTKVVIARPPATTATSSTSARR